VQLADPRTGFSLGIGVQQILIAGNERFNVLFYAKIAISSFRYVFRNQVIPAKPFRCEQLY
jgi:hypothetical protein